MAVLAGFAIPANAGLLGTGPASYCDPVSIDGVQALGDGSNYMLTPGGCFEGGTTELEAHRRGEGHVGNEPYFIHCEERQRFAVYACRVLGHDADDVLRRRRLAHALRRPRLERSSTLRVAVTVNSLLGLVSILDGGTVSSNGTWKPSPKVGLLLTNVGGLLTTKAISLRFTATNGTTQIDDVYLDPCKDT